MNMNSKPTEETINDFERIYDVADEVINSANGQFHEAHRTRERETKKR